MTEPGRYDQLGPEARALVDDFGAADLAEMLVAKNNDIASCNAQQWPQRLAATEHRAEQLAAAVLRIQTLAEQHPVAIPTHLVDEALDQQQGQS